MDIPFPGYAAAAAKSLQSCPTLCNPIDGSPPGSPRPWDSPGKNTGVGCHFLLQCMKVKSESEVAQSCPTLSDPMDCSLIGSSVHGIFQARVLEWGAIIYWLIYLFEKVCQLIELWKEITKVKHFCCKREEGSSHPFPFSSHPLQHLKAIYSPETFTKFSLWGSR